MVLDGRRCMQNCCLRGKGALRLYKVNGDGSEYIVQFALEGSF
jgi:hypothetical protein